MMKDFPKCLSYLLFASALLALEAAGLGAGFALAVIVKGTWAMAWLVMLIIGALAGGAAAYIVTERLLKLRWWRAVLFYFLFNALAAFSALLSIGFFPGIPLLPGLAKFLWLRLLPFRSGFLVLALALLAALYIPCSSAALALASLLQRISGKREE